MPEYGLQEMQKKRTVQTRSGPGTVLILTLLGSDGKIHTAEWLTYPNTVLPSKGDRMVGSIEPSDNPDWAPNWVPEGSKKPSGNQGGKGVAGYAGRGRSPGETKAIQRQHSQHMMLLKEANVIAAGGRPYSEEQQRHVTNWMEKDIASKDTSVTWGGFSDDVPIDETGLPWAEEVASEKS